MSDPAWLPGLVAVITLAITAYCLSRLIAGRVRRRPTDVDVDAAHALMGVGMAAMLVPSLSPVPAVTWAWVFAVVAVWLAWRIARVYRNGTDARLAQAHYVPHLVMSVAMIYMGATASSATTGGSAGGGTAMGGPGAGTAGFPPLTLVLALFMFGYVVWLLDQLQAIPSVRAWRAAPQLALAPAPGVPGAAEPVVRAPVVRAAVAAHAGAVAEVVSGRSGTAGRLDDAAARREVVTDRGVPLSLRLEVGCHIAMAVAMGYMLIVMV